MLAAVRFPGWNTDNSPSGHFSVRGFSRRIVRSCKATNGEWSACVCKLMNKELSGPAKLRTENGPPGCANSWTENCPVLQSYERRMVRLVCKLINGELSGPAKLRTEYGPPVQISWTKKCPDGDLSGLRPTGYVRDSR